MKPEELLAIVAAIMWAGLASNPEAEPIGYDEAVSDAATVIDIARRRLVQN